LKVLHEKVLAYSCHFTYQLNLKKGRGNKCPNGVPHV